MPLPRKSYGSRSFWTRCRRFPIFSTRSISWLRIVAFRSSCADQMRESFARGRLICWVAGLGGLRCFRWSQPRHQGNRGGGPEPQPFRLRRQRPPQVGKENGEIVNYAAIASYVSVDSKTVRSYFEILEDTMIGRFLPLPAKPGSRKHLVATPKFHLFDPGVARILRRVNISALQRREGDRLFETFVAHELRASTAYRKSSRVIHYYRISF